MNGNPVQYSFRFVCQGGGIDIKAAFLAASLKEHLRCTHELIACIPTGENVQQPSDQILEYLSDIDVAIRPISNPLAKDYLIGNKLACLALPTTASKKVFLDSDILCTRPFYGFPETKPYDISAKLEDWNHHSDQEWQQLYHHFQLGMPEMRFRSTVLDQAMPLYFNAGVLVVDKQSNLPEKWIDIAQIIDAQLELPRKRPNLDQLSLAALVVKSSYRWQLLDENYNYPAELRSLNHSSLPYLCHYHDPLMILADGYLSELIARLCASQAKLASIAKTNAHWVWHLAAQEPLTQNYST